uniref:Trafficking protein, kinesin binding 2 n=1 Tax=Cyprinus carpio carpio TaxID=630221 RepID=A0A9J7X6P0_CYPCA
MHCGFVHDIIAVLGGVCVCVACVGLAIWHVGVLAHSFLFFYSIHIYFMSVSLPVVLSADRVEQMTKTYNDIDMVTHLLAERDRDLELAARIGQSLLQRNHVLQERNESLEEQLAQALDQVHQLHHELTKKDELLRMVASASEESETDSSCSTPLRHPAPAGAALALSQLEALQSKLQELEEENLSLRSEACHLKKETSTYEEKEQQLVNDCVKELRESNSQMVSLTDELSQKNEDLMRHQEEIAQLLSQIVELQQRVKELALEKEELRIHLQASKEAQRQLTAELKELSDRNAECVGMLHESQEEIKELRSKSTPSAGLRRHPSYGLYPMDSLAAEIEGSMRRELSVEEEIAFEDQRSTHKRVFQTVRSVNQSVMRAAAAVPPIPGSARSGVVMTPVPYQAHTPNTEEQAGDVDTTKENSRLGQPGSPGGNDLTSALNRLSLRRQNFLCERQFFQAERERKLQELAAAESEGGGSSCSSPMGSTVSSITNLSEFSISSSCFKTFLPEKLQIVKPMEGSLTLHHWQQLAKPHLGTILDPHPGVVTKGFRPLPQDNVYHLTDLEEDENQEKLPWEHKRKEEEPQDSSTFSTYTFTTCRILHPSDSTQVTPSDYTPSSLRTGPSTPVTPCRLSLGDSFPVRRPAAPPGGLAKLLLEKGISSQGRAAVPAPKKPLSLRLLPSTPPNSPSHSPCPSPVPFDSRSTSSDNFLASRPAELFLQDVYGPDRSPHGPSTKPDCPAVNLVEHLRKLGLDKKVLQGSDTEGAHPQESATFLATGGGSLLDGLRRNQSLPVMVGRRSTSVSSPSFPVPPPHPTSLALPTPSWGNLNEPRRTRRHASLSQAPPHLHNS